MNDDEGSEDRQGQTVMRSTRLGRASASSVVLILWHTPAPSPFQYTISQHGGCPDIDGEVESSLEYLIAGQLVVPLRALLPSSRED